MQKTTTYLQMSNMEARSINLPLLNALTSIFVVTTWFGLQDDQLRFVLIMLKVVTIASHFWQQHCACVD